MLLYTRVINYLLLILWIISIINASNDSQIENMDPIAEIPEKSRKFNFALHTAGAVILDKSPPGGKGFSKILNDDQDGYFIAPCAEEKWVVIGLSEDIVVSEIVISNYEKYSSKLKIFNISISTIYPTKDWKHIGTFLAQPILGEQTFTIEGPFSGHTRYLKVNFVEHYGTDHLCTITQIKVHGTTFIATLANEVAANGDSIDDFRTRLNSNDNKIRISGSNSNSGSGGLHPADMLRENISGISLGGNENKTDVIEGEITVVNGTQITPLEDVIQENITASVSETAESGVATEELSTVSANVTESSDKNISISTAEQEDISSESMESINVAIDGSVTVSAEDDTSTNSPQSSPLCVSGDSSILLQGESDTNDTMADVGEESTEQQVCQSISIGVNEIRLTQPELAAHPPSPVPTAVPASTTDESLPESNSTHTVDSIESIEVIEVKTEPSVNNMTVGDGGEENTQSLPQSQSLPVSQLESGHQSSISEVDNVTTESHINATIPATQESNITISVSIPAVKASDTTPPVPSPSPLPIELNLTYCVDFLNFASFRETALQMFDEDEKHGGKSNQTGQQDNNVIKQLVGRIRNLEREYALIENYVSRMSNCYHLITLKFIDLEIKSKRLEEAAELELEEENALIAMSETDDYIAHPAEMSDVSGEDLSEMILSSELLYLIQIFGFDSNQLIQFLKRMDQHDALVLMVVCCVVSTICVSIALLCLLFFLIFRGDKDKQRVKNTTVLSSAVQ